MSKTVFTLCSTRALTHDTFELVLSGDTTDITRPGQFVNLELPERFLRRPISVCDWNEETLTLLVRIAGQGTDQLCHLSDGTKLDVLTGLGNGFDLDKCDDTPILLGGGIGLAPLYGLSKAMLHRGIAPPVIAGFRTGSDVLYVKELEELGCTVHVATEDGTMGTKGFVTHAAETHFPNGRYAFVCGPTPMLSAVAQLPQLTGGQFSFEARMGCGFGACMGCTMEVVGGYKRICKDGPILYKEELVW